ncbi:hypothetical protein [Puia dinghuensis]|uniref:VCBS repeat-containing protein n=1 Tax=Puia dinghuensis TaxID=1792502 RepID=A0A8J2XPP8_9BACT|nr:hypothetical protein [Puia dinghuensis]GGA81573.1 hypothetical protein GCM10011511_00640 [Puia dinghuensis]
MKRQYLLLLLGSFFFLTTHAQITFNKIDTTMKIGKAGYRVTCRNRSITENPLLVRPIGMESDAREINSMLKGRLYATQIDDLNADGYPDLLLYIYTDSNAVFGTVYAVISQANKSLVACFLPDVSLDGKINKGYKGHDKFSLLEGTLLQQFPIYNPGDDKDKPTGGTRTLLYQLSRGEGGGFKFTRIRFYDTK